MLAAFAFALAGCGGGGDSSADQATEPGTTSQTAPTGTETADGTATGEGNAQNGEIIFVTNGCGFCHTLADVDADGTVGPNLDEAKPSYDLVVERVTNGKGAMPSFRDDITPQDIQDVAAYVTEVAGQ